MAFVGCSMTVTTSVTIPLRRSSRTSACLFSCLQRDPSAFVSNLVPPLPVISDFFLIHSAGAIATFRELILIFAADVFSGNPSWLNVSNSCNWPCDFETCAHEHREMSALNWALGRPRSPLHDISQLVVQSQGLELSNISVAGARYHV